MPRALASAYAAQVCVEARLGRYEQAREEGAKAIRLCSAIGAERLEFVVGGNLMEFALERGDIDDAMEIGRALTARLRDSAHSDVEAFVQKWLGTLAGYDERKHTELVKTLTQYLQHGGGYEATSRALSVHRSTLKYRLQRIRELTGFELGDPETLFNLQLATRAWLTLQALRGEGTPGRWPPGSRLPAP